MITFYTQKIGEHYRCEVVRSFAGYASEIRRTFQGNVEELRAELRIDYRVHIDRIMLMYLDHILIDPKGPFALASIDAMRDAQATSTSCDHVTLAKALQMIDLFAPLKPGAEAYGFAILATRTIGEMCSGEKSLWVRGPIELLDGSIIEPWKITTDARSAA